MQVRSNRIDDITKHYKARLQEKFQHDEARFLLYWLIEAIAGIPSHELPLASERRVSESQLIRIHKGVKDLLKDRPIQYITGQVEFHDVMLNVDENVLIPRPETEELVSLIARDSFRPESVMDIGCGSGAISVALQKALNTKLTAVDVDSGAISVAIGNALRNDAPVHFMKMDVLKKSEWSELDIRFDMLVSNPPYVRDLEKEMMAVNVLDYEPHKALFVSDKDPLVFYRTLAEMARLKLNEGGHVWLEINEYLAEETAELFRPAFGQVDIIKDFRDKDRFIHAY